MSNQNLVEENERLNRELAAMTKSRDQFRAWLCQALRFESDPEILERDLPQLLARMQNRPPQDVDELLREILPPEMHGAINGSISKSQVSTAP